jgi:hypothetical protein
MVQTLVKKFDEHCEYTKKELGEIKRGVYGDPANKVPGLIDRQLNDERRLNNIEEERKKEKQTKKIIIAVGTFIFAILQGIAVFIYEVFFNKN